MKVYSILVLNKSGSLIYQNEIHTGLTKLTANDYLILAGTLHGVHAIGSKLTSTINSNNSTTATKPSAEELNTQHNASILATGKQLSSNSNRSGLKSLETNFFNLYIYQTVSGLKFILITTPNLNDLQVKQIDELFKLLYIAYSDYVMKNPFYSLDMPIKCTLFDRRVKEVLS